MKLHIWLSKTAIDPALYEAVAIDSAGRCDKIKYVTIPWNQVNYHHFALMDFDQKYFFSKNF